jgi:serine/threonine protein kinase
MSDVSPHASDESRATIGPYEIVKVLARGERETVYLGFEPSSEREVAIRVSPDDGPGPGEQAAREGTAVLSLVHRHILRVFDVGQDQGLSYVVEEVRRGQTLAEMMRDDLRSVDVTARIDLIAQLCTGLHFIHEQGRIHGDVKPDNVFVTSEGVVKLLNLGAVKVEEMTIVSDRALSGSFEYYSPEQLMGREDIDGRSDLFSAAVILYELVSGRRPFHGSSTATTLARIVREDPTPLDDMPELDAVVRRALEKDPAKRFASAQEFAYALWTIELGDHAAEGRGAETDSETVHDVRVETLQLDRSGFAAWLDTLPVARQTLAYIAIGAAGLVIGSVVFLRAC